MVKINPTKICIRSVPYLHQISANWALDMVIFDALVLILPLDSSKKKKEGISSSSII